VFEKVKREIKVLRQFNHPHIIKHFEFVDTTSDIFMVLEYASGGELFDLISRREKVSYILFMNLISILSIHIETRGYSLNYIKLTTTSS
jgi:serine/threonine protein kinase